MARMKALAGGALIAVLLVLAGAAPAGAADDAWADLRAALFGEREILDGTGVIALGAERAHDAALVPITVEALSPQTPERSIATIHLLVDRNPAPLAAVFHLSPESGLATIATRVRVDAYTDVRAIAETTDGRLYMASRFVKASGGCSAPALKDHEQAMARLGEMRLNHGPIRLGEPNQVQLLISHPNYSGLQIDQLSRHWIPPHYLRTVEVSWGGETVLRVEADISLSENPSLHFAFVPEAAGELKVEAEDSKGQLFAQRFAIGEAGS